MINHIELAKECEMVSMRLYEGNVSDGVTGYSFITNDVQLAAFANAIIEQCASIAESRYKVMKDTEKAHYRLSPEPFIAANFGFDVGELSKSRSMAESIRALKVKG